MVRRCWTAEAGYTLAELLIAAGLTLALSALTASLLADARSTVDLSRERMDVQQRARVALEAVASSMRQSGAGAVRGTAAGALSAWLPTIWPGRTDRLPVSDAVTMIRAAAGVPAASLAAAAPAGTTSLAFDRAGCPLPCGFVDGTIVLLMDGRGDFDLFVLTDTDGAAAIVRRLQGGTAASYAAGAAVVAVEVRTYYRNAITSELRSDDGDRGDFPVANDVVGTTFELVGEPDPPAQPRPPAGEENCLFDASGAPRSELQRLAPSGGTFAPLSLSIFEDGPWCGTGAEPYDADLLRIRAVRLTLRLQAGSAAYRGLDPRLFSAPGTARDPARTVPDLLVQTTVAPRNLGGWR